MQLVGTQDNFIFGTDEMTFEFPDIVNRGKDAPGDAFCCRDAVVTWGVWRRRSRSYLLSDSVGKHAFLIQQDKCCPSKTRPKVTKTKRPVPSTAIARPISTREDG
jgi:hypothetical protein